MASSHHDNVSMAVFCDFENVALGVRDAKYEKFDIKRVLERLLLKGSIVVKKAYCDWERYKGFKATMHEASFELIEIPHVRQSGKNSADIRLVVDALDLCYTKSHVNTFVIISGDSDFSPLVSKLRENAKQVIGVGVKQSTSDLLIANCDEFIFYDDLVRESERAATKPERESQPAKRSPDEEQRRREDQERRKTQAVELAVETFDALVAERGDSGKIWASLLKEAIKRRKPGFNESYYGFRAFGNLLEEAQSRGLLELGRDEKSGTYVHRATNGTTADMEPAVEPAATQPAREGAAEQPAEEAATRHEARRRGRGRRPADREHVAPPAPVVDHDAVAEPEARATTRDVEPVEPVRQEEAPVADARARVASEIPGASVAEAAPAPAPAEVPSSQAPASEGPAESAAASLPRDKGPGGRTPRARQERGRTTRPTAGAEAPTPDEQPTSQPQAPRAKARPEQAATPAAAPESAPAAAATGPTATRPTVPGAGAETPASAKPARKTGTRTPRKPAAAKAAAKDVPDRPAAETGRSEPEPPAASAQTEEATGEARKPAARRRARKPAAATDEG